MWGGFRKQSINYIKMNDVSALRMGEITIQLIIVLFRVPEGSRRYLKKEKLKKSTTIQFLSSICLAMGTDFTMRLTRSIVEFRCDIQMIRPMSCFCLLWLVWIEYTVTDFYKFVSFARKVALFAYRNSIFCICFSSHCCNECVQFYVSSQSDLLGPKYWT